MDYIDAASAMAGRSRLEGSGARHVTNAHAVTGTAMADSSDGTVLVDLGGDVTTGDGSQWVEVQTDAHVLEGDQVDVLLVGEAGRGMSPVIYGVPGGGDRMAVSVSNAETLAQQAEAVASATGQNFWPDTDGVHVTQVTKDEWNDSTSPNYHSGANVLLNALGQLFRDGLNNILAILSGTTPGVAIYDGQGNTADNILAEFTSSGSTIGRVTEGHVTTDTDSVTFYDGSDELFNIGPSSSGGPSINTTRNDYYVGSDRGTTPPLVSYVHGNTNSVQDYGDGSIVELHANAQYDNALKMAHVDVFSPASGNSISSESKIRLDADRIILDGSYLQPYYADQYGTVTTADVPMEQAIAALTTPLYSNQSNVTINRANTDISGPSVTVPAGAYIIVVAYTFPTASGSGTRVTTIGYKPASGAAQHNTFVQGSRAAARLSMFNIVHITAQTSFTAYVRSDQTISSASGLYIGMTRIS